MITQEKRHGEQGEVAPLPEIAGNYQTLLQKSLQKGLNIRAIRTAQWRLLTASLLVLDISMAALAFGLAYFTRFNLSLPFFAAEARSDITYYRSLAGIFLVLMLIVFFAKGLYNRRNILGGTQEYALIFDSVTALILLIITFTFLIPEFTIARAWLVISWFLVFFFVALGRFLGRRVVYLLRERGYYLSSAIIVGANDEGISLARQLNQWKTSGFHILGFVDNKLTPNQPVMPEISCLGNVRQLEEVVQNFNVEEIILATSSFSTRDHMVDIFRQYGVDGRVKIRFSSGLYEIMTTGLTVTSFAYVPLVGVNPVRLTGTDRVLKTLLDYCLVIPGLILSSPIFLLLALLIKLDSPGPIIHRRQVMGVNGKKFNAFKFRTMHENGDEILKQFPELMAELEETHKLKNDPRITRVGKILRKFSLDEIPQAFNVLFGQMSLVGPRMISPPEMDKYDRWDMNLLTVRPGITGLWQVSGRSDITYEERVRIDMQYIRNWSIWLDIHILLQTIPAVLKGHGAY
jgi:exopolysaccharide biosynthesis polyprenyl glycosylphosphotransferase